MRWARLDASLWWTIAERLPKPWPTEAAIAELRVVYARDGRPPPRRAMADRWGWGEKAVRLLIQDADAWMDPYLRGAQQGPTKGPT